MIESQTSTTNPLHSGVPWLDWLFRATLVVVVGSIASAHAPTRVKLLGLFSIAVGCGMGATAAYLTKPHPSRTPPKWLLILSLLALIGLTGSTWLAFRSDVTAKPKSDQQQLAATMMMQMERDSGGEIASVSSDSAINEFRWYLTRRVQQLGGWSSPWPELFWCGELLAGSCAAAVGWKIGVDQSRKTAVSEEVAT